MTRIGNSSSGDVKYVDLPPSLTCQFRLCRVDVAEVLLYVHRNRRFIRDGSPGRSPRLSHSSWTLVCRAAAHSSWTLVCRAAAHSSWTLVCRAAAHSSWTLVCRAAAHSSWTLVCRVAASTFNSFTALRSRDHLKTTNKSAKSETFKPFCLLFRTRM